MIIKVYNHGQLDGVGYEDTNEYIKVHEESFFDMLTYKPMNYEKLVRYILSRENAPSLEELRFNGRTTMDELDFYFNDGISEGPIEKDDDWPWPPNSQPFY